MNRAVLLEREAALDRRIAVITKRLVEEKRRHYPSIASRLARRGALYEELQNATRELIDVRAALLELRTGQRSHDETEPPTPTATAG